MKPILLLCALAAFAPCAVLAQEQTAHSASLSAQSQARALALLHRAADALGGADALLDLRSIRVSLRGKATSRFQAPSAAPPFEQATSEFDLYIDFSGEQSAFRSFDDEAGGLRHSLSVVGEEPRIYNLHACTSRPHTTPPSFTRELASHALRAPHLLLRAALSDPLNLRFHGSHLLENRLHGVISVSINGESVALYIEEATGLVSRAEPLYADMLAGPSASETVFGDYAGEGVARAPRSLILRQAGQDTLRGELAIQIDPKLAHNVFSPPGEFLQVPASRPFAERVEELAKGVHVLHSVSDPAHNALLVEFDRFVAVVDAPHSSEGSERLIERARELAPGKPVRFVVLTHHHDDHMAGLRSFIAEGARVITTPDNREIVKALVSAPHDDRLSTAPELLQFDPLVGTKRVITDGKRVLELHSVGPVPHAKEMLVAYLPSERVLFQSDLFIVPSNEATVGTPTPSLVALGEAVDRLDLDVAWIAGGHGRTATIEEFWKRVRYQNPRQCAW